jgi:putative transposase
MARRLRLQFGGALYHIINRGNYRRDVFETAGAATAFEKTLSAACIQFQWRLHAYALMRNHFHLALETPEPNLVDGMHWLQSAFATRFNRFRRENGHLFQGRYQARLIEGSTSLVRVVNYIHLNPVRAQLVRPEQVAQYRWTSLRHLIHPPRPSYLVADSLLSQYGLTDTAEDWALYVDELKSLAGDPLRQEREGLTNLSKDWAIGTSGWRRALAEEHSAMAISVGIDAKELSEIKEAKWRLALGAALMEAGKDLQSLREPKGSPWKIDIAVQLRREVAAPYVWIARALAMGSPSSVRVYVCRRINK